jgi:uncharacterized protein YndB with AHSA1/START domain
MKTTLLMDFIVEKENKKVIVKKEFAAPVADVWSAWTDSKLLDQWWAPKPWKARTKKMDFKVGGTWLYAMVGPDGSEHWARADYKSITPEKNYKALDAFCDKDGNLNNEMPRSNWSVSFNPSSDSTVVQVEILHDRLEDLEKLIEMGFKEGFIAALGNLDEVLEKK